MTTRFGEYFRKNNSFNPISNGYNLYGSAMRNPLQMGWLFTHQIDSLNTDIGAPLVAGHEPQIISSLMTRYEEMTKVQTRFEQTNNDFIAFVENEVETDPAYIATLAVINNRVIGAGEDPAVFAAQKEADKIQLYDVMWDPILTDIRNGHHLNPYPDLQDVDDMDQYISDHFADDAGTVYAGWDDLMQGLFEVRGYFNGGEYETHKDGFREYNSNLQQQEFGMLAMKNKKLG